jgi:hypothetical protein
VEPSHAQRRCLGYASLRELIAVRMLLAERLRRPIRTHFPENDPERGACQLVAAVVGLDTSRRQQVQATGASAECCVVKAESHKIRSRAWSGDWCVLWGTSGPLGTWRRIDNAEARISSWLASGAAKA